jgi:hypothetical protein
MRTTTRRGQGFGKLKPQGLTDRLQTRKRNPHGNQFPENEKSCGSAKHNRQRLSGTEPGSGKAEPQGDAPKEQTIITVIWNNAIITVVAKYTGILSARRGSRLVLKPG